MTDPVSGVIGSQTFDGELHEITSLVSPDHRLVIHNGCNDFNCLLEWIQFDEFGNQQIQLLDSRLEHLIQAFVLRPVRGPDFASSIVPVLVPVDDFYEKIGSPPYSLAALGVLEIQRIGFVILYLSRRAESVSAVMVESFRSSHFCLSPVLSTRM